MEEVGSATEVVKATKVKISRRSVLKGGTAIAAGAATSTLATQTNANAATFNPKKFSWPALTEPFRCTLWNHLTDA